ncbi:MAG: hypothetical protein JWP03_847 [Phycisphaerales bacterium]|jgi:hypothetical protein|nr:hypothetical protein [Phycisphaerales bacterium]
MESAATTANKHLATYLNDHLAGSVTLLELLSHLASAYADTPVARFATELHGDIAADRATLESLMEMLHIPQSAMRKASAWVAEKFAQLKLRLDDHSGGALRLLEATEVISLGIEGKRLLWLALAAASQGATQLCDPGYERLIRRAMDQRSRVEAVRREAAILAMSTPAATAS